MELSPNSSTFWRPIGIYKEITAVCMGKFETLLNLRVFWSSLLRLHCTRLGSHLGFFLIKNRVLVTSAPMIGAQHRMSYSLNPLRGGYIGDYRGLLTGVLRGIPGV